MKKNFENQHFEILTLAGYRYTITWSAVKRWFTSKRWWLFIILCEVALICFMPQNVTYNFDIFQRIFFWPISTSVFLVVYLSSLYWGGRWAVQKSGRVFYTPVGTVLAVAASTSLSEFYLYTLDHSHDMFGVQMWLEFIFNVLTITIIEAMHYAVTNPTSERRKETDLKSWEKF